MAKKQLQGTDVSVEISLKDHGFAWIQGETETFFLYGVQGNGEGEYCKFNYAYFQNDTDVKSEFDWVDWDRLMKFIGMNQVEWDAQPFTQKMFDLYNYYGSEEIFGECDGNPYSQSRFMANRVKVS